MNFLVSGVYVKCSSSIQGCPLVARALDVEIVQICNNLPFYTMGEKELDQLWIAARESGIKIQLGTRGVRPDHLLVNLKIAEILHADMLRTIIDTPNTRLVTSWLREVLPRFLESEVTIGIENTEILRAKEYANLIRNLDDSHVGIVLDTLNSMGALENLERIAGELLPYVVSLHFKDFNIRRIQQAPPIVVMGYEIVGCPAGEGRVDAEWLFDILQKSGNDPDVILELWPPFLGTIEKTIENENEWVSKSVKFLKAMVK